METTLHCQNIRNPGCLKYTYSTVSKIYVFYCTQTRLQYPKIYVYNSTQYMCSIQNSKYTQHPKSLYSTVSNTYVATVSKLHVYYIIQKCTYSTASKISIFYRIHILILQHPKHTYFTIFKILVFYSFKIHVFYSNQSACILQYQKYTFYTISKMHVVYSIQNTSILKYPKTCILPYPMCMYYTQYQKYMFSTISKMHVYVVNSIHSSIIQNTCSLHYKKKTCILQYQKCIYLYSTASKLHVLYSIQNTCISHPSKYIIEYPKFKYI